MQTAKVQTYLLISTVWSIPLMFVVTTILWAGNKGSDQSKQCQRHIIRGSTYTSRTGPSCSKLTISLVNISFKLRSLNIAYTLTFLLKKMWVAFAFAKATHIFSAKVPVNLILYLLDQLTFWPLTIVFGFNDTSTLVSHFVSSPREREKRDRRDRRRDEREEQGRKRNRNESEETEEIITSPSTLTCYKDSILCPSISQYQLDATVT